MRRLPRLQFLNGLQVDKDAIAEDQAAVASVQPRVTQVPEVNEEEEDSRIEGPSKEINASVLSMQENTPAINDYLDTEELEAMAMCFDNVRKLRTESQLPNNNDEQLGEQFDTELNNLISTLTDAVADK